MLNRKGDFSLAKLMNHKVIKSKKDSTAEQATGMSIPTTLPKVFYYVDNKKIVSINQAELYFLPNDKQNYIKNSVALVDKKTGEYVSYDNIQDVTNAKINRRIINRSSFLKKVNRHRKKAQADQVLAAKKIRVQTNPEPLVNTNIIMPVVNQSHKGLIQQAASPIGLTPVTIAKPSNHTFSLFSTTQSAEQLLQNSLAEYAKLTQ